MSVKGRIIGISTGLALALAAGLTDFEGNKSMPYRDIGGVWTACVGDTNDIIPSHKYSNQECQERLEKQLKVHNDGLLKCAPELLQGPEHVHAAVLDLTYNIGVGAVCKSSIVAKVKAKKYPEACATITEFRYAAGRDCSVRSNQCYGVWKRRQWERALCEGDLNNDQIAKGYAGYLEASQ